MNSSRRLTRGAFAFSAVAIGGGVITTAPAFASPTPQSITTLAGNGTSGSTGDGGVAVHAELNAPTGVALDLTSNLYIADSGNNKVRKVVHPTTLNQDIISTAAGNGTRGFAGDGGSAVAAELNTPTGIAVDGAGDLFIADTGNNRIREVVASTGHIKTFAGNGRCGKSAPLGNGGSATSASLCSPTGVALDTSGNVYISDSGHSEVRVVNTSGVIMDFAGNGSYGYSGDGGQATKAQLGIPSGVVADSAHDVFIADSADTVVRKVNSAGVITTFAGTGKFGYSGDGGPATKAKLQVPTGVGVDTFGDVIIADTFNNRLREVNAAGTISTIAGTGANGFSGDGGPATQAKLSIPTGAVAVDGTAIYFSDSGNERVRGIFNGPPPVLPETAWVVALPIGVVAILGGFVLYRRRRSMATA